MFINGISKDSEPHDNMRNGRPGENTRLKEGAEPEGFMACLAQDE